MRPIVNVPEEDRATDIGNMHKNLVKIARVVPEISCRTDRQTDAFITILRNRSRGRNNEWQNQKVWVIRRLPIRKRVGFKLGMKKVMDGEKKITWHRSSMPSERLS